MWDQIREVELERAQGLCEVCGQSARHVHEKWEYDDERLVQRLRGFEILCRECHLVHHPGFAGVHRVADLAFKRLVAVNSLTKAAAMRMTREAFNLWRLRSSKGPWKQDFSWLVSNAGVYGLEPEQVKGAIDILDEKPEDVWSEMWDVPTIGAVRAEILEGWGIRTIRQLASSDPADLLARSSIAQIRDASFPSQLAMAVSFAQAIYRLQPVTVPHPPQLLNFDDSRILFVDLEYDPEDAFIFLIGTMTMEGKIRQDFVDPLGVLKRRLASFIRRVQGGGLQCVSYGSTSADIPMLRRAVANGGMDVSLVDRLPFLDLFRDVIFTQNPRKQWLYLPLKPMDAKRVAHYFGHDDPQNLAIRDGLEALMRYKEYRRTHSPKIRQQLLQYNANDLKLTRRIFEELRSLEAGRADIQNYRPIEPAAFQFRRGEGFLSVTAAEDLY